MITPWLLRDVPLDREVPTAALLELLTTIERRPLAAGLIDWLAGRGPLRRLAIAEHRPGTVRLIDRYPTGKDASGCAGRGWPLGGDGLCWPAVDRTLVRSLHAGQAHALRVAIGRDGDEVCVLFPGEPDSAYAIHASRDPGLGGFPDDELERWAKVAVLLRQAMRQRSASPPPTTVAQRICAAAELLLARAPHLSPREQEVVARIACGVTNDGIAADLGLSPATILTLRRRAYAKLGIRSCVELRWLSH